MKFFTSKLFIIIFGVLFLITGYFLNNMNVENIVVALLMIVGMVVMLGTIAWKKLFDKNTDVSDVTGGSALISSVLLLAGAIAKLLDVQLWSWVNKSITSSLILVGVFVIYLGLRNKA